MKQFILSIDSSLALIAVLINIVFALLVLFRTSMTIVYRTFFFICLSTVIWNLGDFMGYYTAKRSWFYFSLIGTGMIPALMFHFISTLVRPEQKSSFWLVPLYVLSGLLAMSSPLALFDAGIQKFVESFVWNVCYLFLLAPVFLWAIVGLVKAGQKAGDEEKNRLRYVLIATLIGVFTGVTDLVQVLKIPVPSLGHLGTVVYSAILAIGVFKHRTAYDILAQTRLKLEALSDMAAGIAHEIRNPLSSIKGATRLLSHELKNFDNPKHQEYLGIMTEEIERLNNILINFQYFTKPIRMEKELISVNDVVQKTVKLAESDTLDIGMRVDLSGDLPLVQADASSIKQVFLNLIKNAAEACGPEGELAIKTEYSCPWVKISFSDNGPGIPAELLNHIFEPFFTTKATGMGVGLAISRRIVDAHNGRIEVRNLLPKGAEFSILLPAGG
ncbi:MAG: ATP-binding protein [Nitrospirae bacterium]|nr:ATP-binding protein [Nitrospirota bacterium]MCL5422210.1 ATP-binding protein [Nitrospirota bacterium]